MTEAPEVARSGTCSYLMASRRGQDPRLKKVDRYVQLLRELKLRLVKAVRTRCIIRAQPSLSMLPT